MTLALPTVGKKRFKLHAPNFGRPVCGGGNGGSGAHYETDYCGSVTCIRCLRIIRNRKVKVKIKKQKELLPI